MVLLGKIMILQGVGHQISCLGVCYANDPKKGGYTTPAPALDLTTSLRGDFANHSQMTLKAVSLRHLKEGVVPILMGASEIAEITILAASRGLNYICGHNETRFGKGLGLIVYGCDTSGYFAI